MIRPSKIKEKRNHNDNYLTPYSVIQQLLDVINIDKWASILEPCCSPEMTIVKTLKKNDFCNVIPNLYDETNPMSDFLKFDENVKYDYIITNSPYGDIITTNFINKMKKIATKQIICLYPMVILCGSKRYDRLWNDEEFKLKEIYVLVRPCLLTNEVREDGKYKTGMSNYAWFIWEKGFSGDTTIKHIDNTEFVLRKLNKNK